MFNKEIVLIFVVLLCLSGGTKCQDDYFDKNENDDETNSSKLTSIIIKEDNWRELLTKGEWMVEFYAPWCPACRRFESTWNKFSSMSDELSINVGSADVSSSPLISVIFSITSLPTVYQ
jgi:thiol:disulfide interchange protein